MSRIGFRAKLGRSREKRREDRVGFLVENFHIDPKQLVAVGFVEEKLKNAAEGRCGQSRCTRSRRPPAGKQPQ